MRTTTKTVLLHPALLCSLLLILCLALAHPIAETGMNDDPSFMWSARVAAQTGRIVYNGWATPILTWMLYLGALFIKLFGFSFTILRVSIATLSIAVIFLLQRLFERCGVSRPNATLGTLTVVLSPLFVPLSFSFMTDIAGLFTILLCMDLCVSALKASTDRAACAWIAAAALTNAAVGSIRQITWLGVLLIVPCTAFLLRRRRGVLPVAAASWLISVAFIFLCMRWFAHQPYSITEPLIAKAWDRSTVSEITGYMLFALDFFLFLLPVSAAFLVRYPWRNRAGKLTAALGMILLLGSYATFLRHHRYDLFLAPFAGNYFTPRGLIDVPELLGQRADSIPLSLRVLLTALTFASILALMACVWNALGSRPQNGPFMPASSALSWTTLLTLFGPYSLVYLVLLATRNDLWDRYLLPFLFVSLVFLLRFYEQQFGGRLPILCALLLAGYAIIDTAGMHDVFAMTRARLEAVDEIRAAGVPRTEIRAGFDTDVWTQLELTGYYNDSRLKIPAGVFHPVTPPPVPERCQYDEAEKTPDIHPRFGLSFSPPTDCYPAAASPPHPLHHLVRPAQPGHLHPRHLPRVAAVLKTIHARKALPRSCPA